MSSICISVPCYGGQITMRCARSLLATAILGAKHNRDVKFHFMEGESLIQRARNQAVHTFLKECEPGDKMLFVDADLEFDPQWVFLLDELDRDVVGMAYPRKRLEWDEMKGSDDPQRDGASYFIQPEPGAGDKVKIEGGCIPVRWLGTGFMMMKYETITRMCAEYPETAHVSDTYGSQGECVHALFDCGIDEKDGIYLSEDYFFCKRWQAIGGRIWLSLHGSPSHIGNHVYQGNLEKLVTPVEGDN